MKNTQKGRSMVEMLGVLAIIGVLSVGGIAGYTVAMNRYRANQILDMASKVAIIAQTMNAGQGGPVCVSSGTCASDDVGLKWSTTGNVTGFTADATSTGATSDTVTVNLTVSGSIPDGVKNAMESIAGSDVYSGGTSITIKTN